jgi:hypothetical protein
VVDINLIEIRPIDMQGAKRLCKMYHYMKTAPSGALLAFGIFHPQLKGVKGILVFGRSTGTDAKAKLFPKCEPENILEMQRMWISDDLGHNAESKTISLVMKMIKDHYEKIKIVWTYAGGCKNDCGIVYQSSGFMYLGCEPCEDFYLTDSGEYKNIINVLRFGKAPKELKSKEEKAAFVYGPGKLLKTKRYYYFYPLDKAVRRKMEPKCLPFPKDSEIFRRDQSWV